MGGQQVQYEPEIDGGEATKWKVIGDLPEGLVFSELTGEISGQLHSDGTVGSKKVIISASNKLSTVEVEAEFVVQKPQPKSDTSPKKDSNAEIRVGTIIRKPDNQVDNDNIDFGKEE